MMPRETPGRLFSAILIALLFLGVILTRFRTVVGWMDAWEYSRVLRFCGVSLRILTTSHRSRFVWSIGPMRRVRDLAGVSSGPLHLQVLTQLQLTAFVRTMMG